MSIAMIAGLTAIPAATAIPWDTKGAFAPIDTPSAEAADPLCNQSYADDAPRGGPRIRFGIGPRLAGEIGAGQTTPLVKGVSAKRDAAIAKLAGNSSFTVRLNRILMENGRAACRERV